MHQHPVDREAEGNFSNLPANLYDMKLHHRNQTWEIFLGTALLQGACQRLDAEGLGM